jgi:ubiquitin-protein ligase
MDTVLYIAYSATSVAVLCYAVEAQMVEPMLKHLLLTCLEPGEKAILLEDECANAKTMIITPSPNRVRPRPSFAILQAEREQALRDYKVTIEYKHLKSHAPGGVYLIPSMNSLRKFYGVIFVRRGPFTNGIFKFELELPLQYNDINQHPEITFTSAIYNPYVDAVTGKLDMKTTYPRWDPSRHYLVTVLTFLKKIFYAKTFEEAVANLEAKTLAATNPTAFRTKVDQCVRESQKAVFLNDKNEDDVTLKFTEERLGHRVLRDLLKGTVKDPAQVSKNLILTMIDKASKV